MVLMIDNYDSFTFNIVQYMRELGARVDVIKNDCQPTNFSIAFQPNHLVISPGPRTPNEAGISISAIRKFAGHVPILGICLGHQCIAQVFGGTIIQSQDIMHGKTSSIFHNEEGIFEGLSNPFRAMRYHSLVLSSIDLPKNLEITAWTQKPDGSLDEIMGIKHKTMPINGVQFHPESILSEHGHLLFKNFLNNKS